ncbi:putative phage terminase large subunit-like protein [Albidovulum inexpectatum]|uniref:Putative phage terminase large subunit-like protein n=1 Tax=Albidovulum inexpectatum TaxID=196587 RepID=A0A2S5JIQ6_9RHOB|nr:phage terminase large subunit [Albidovulum inexpectatum]PPB81353.1 putative phage terminase large subunit-like protein [Albidovulum inexpectatum]
MTKPDPALIRQAALAVCRDDFFAFLWRAFDTLHAGAGVKFVPAWHVRAMCHELEALRAGENKRLVITIPPRCLKSVTVAWPAFLLGHAPGAKIIVASYGLDLARKHAEDCRKIISAQWYQEIFPATRLARTGNTVEEIRTTSGGSRKAVSIGGAVTGHGADHIIIDDLMKAADATSEAELIRAQDFIEGTLLSRFDNPSEGRVVMVAQRLHEMDPPGYLIDKGTYRHLNLPAIAETHERVAIGRGRVHERRPGDLLFPERLDRETLDRMRREMGSAVFNCQYQQNPVAPEGSPLRWEWFGTWDEALPRARYQLIVQSWDTGMSADPRSDWSVCTTWGYLHPHWHLLDLWRGQLDYPDLRARVMALDRQWAPEKILIEDAATGKPLLDELARAGRDRRFVAIRPDQNKETRFSAACAPVQEGKVMLPREAPWLPAFRHELQAFPRGRNDDQVDSFSQFLNWSRTRGFLRALRPEHPLKERRRRDIRRRP